MLGPGGSSRKVRNGWIQDVFEGQAGSICWLTGLVDKNSGGDKE